MKFLIAVSSILISLSSYANWEQVQCSGYPEAVNVALSFGGNAAGKETLNGSVGFNYDSATLKVTNCKKSYIGDAVKSILCEGVWKSGAKLELIISRSADGTYKGEFSSDMNVKRFGCIVRR